MGGRLVKEEDYSTPVASSTDNMYCILPEKSKFFDLKVIIGVVTLSVISTIISVAALSVVLATLHVRTEKLENTGGRGDMATTEKGPASTQTTIETTYLGCFEDDSNRDLPLRLVATDNDIPGCQEKCRNRGYWYAGVQHGRECFCGNRYGMHGEREESHCNMTCFGNKKQICGGYWRISIYTSGYTGPACLDGYQLNPFSETCLRLVEDTKNWDQAVAACESKREHLAVFDSADSILWFKSLRKTEWNSTRTYYIGGRRIGGQWMWRGRINTTIEIADWEQVQPDSSGDCLVVFNFGRAQPSTLFENYKWDDTSCDVQRYFVCERGAERQLN